MSDANFWTLILVGGTILILAFTAGREFYLWYTKTNELIRLQKEQNEYLKRIADHLAPMTN